MMAWFIRVPEKARIPFYVFLAKRGMLDNIVCMSRHMTAQGYVTLFFGKFEISFAEQLEKDAGVTMLIMGPAELWRRALNG